MAETVAGPFVSFVVQMLGNVLSQEAKSLRGVKGQVLQMQTELNRMQCFLKDAAARREEGDKTVHNLVAEIREAAYDADDAIDTFIVKVAFRRGTGILNVLMRHSCVVKDYIAIHKVGVEIESIKTKISDITSRFQTYNVRAISEGESLSSSRYEKQRLLLQPYPHIMEEDVVGLDEDLTKIVEYLVKERECRVVSIWGMGGLGKATLAKKVYNYIDVRRHFDCFAWAFISQQCNTREVLEGILIELTSPSHEERKKIKTMSHGELVVELYRVQSQKKCFPILPE